MTRVRVQHLVGEPTVSVVIPCYNYAGYLPAAVASAAGQTGVRVEIIVVDDASTDESAAVAQSLADEDARIRVIRHARNAGHIATYNDGLAEATGEYVVLLSADDLLAEGSLARSAALFEAHPSVGLVYGYAETFEDEPPVADRRGIGWSVWEGGEWLDRMCRRGSNIIVNPEAIMRRTLLAELGYYDADLPQTADMDLWMRAAARADVGRVHGPVQAYYRVHGANMHLTTFAGAFTDLKARAATFEHFFAVDAVLLPDDTELHDTARKAMATEAVRSATLMLASDDGRLAADEVADFACEIWPAVLSDPAWRRYVHRRRHGAGALRQRFEARIDTLRWSLRWRRWRRYGT